MRGLTPTTGARRPTACNSHPPTNLSRSCYPNPIPPTRGIAPHAPFRTSTTRCHRGGASSPGDERRPARRRCLVGEGLSRGRGARPRRDRDRDAAGGDDGVAVAPSPESGGKVALFVPPVAAMSSPGLLWSIAITRPALIGSRAAKCRAPVLSGVAPALIPPRQPARPSVTDRTHIGVYPPASRYTSPPDPPDPKQLIPANRAFRGYSSAGRAPGSHPGGRRFESA